MKNLYDVCLLDGGSDVGSTGIHADSRKEAIETAISWAKGGDWDHPGSVTLIIGVRGVEVFRGEVVVGG